MKLNVKKQIEQDEEVDMELPAFFSYRGTRVMICEDGTIVKACECFSSLSKKGDLGHDKDLAEILSSGKPSSSGEFHSCLQNHLELIAAQAGYSAALYLLPESETV